MTKLPFFPLPFRPHALAVLLAGVVGPAIAAPTITKFPVSQTATVGQSVTFSVEATGTAPLSYQWYRGATAIAGATANTYTIPSVAAADAGVYAIAVTDATGTTRTFTSYSRAFAAGTAHALYTKGDGTLWAAGNNSSGQLGDGTLSANRTIPVSIATNVAAVATGDNHSLFVKTDGTLWVMGSNGNGQLGDGTTFNRPSPVQVATNVAAVAAGSAHSLFLKTDGTLWAMGYNIFGQLGDGSGTSRSTPVQVASGVRSIAARNFQSFFVKTDGTLWAFGLNSSGQLGDGTFTNRPTPVQVATGVASVAAGATHTLFVKTDGTAWGMGYNGNGQLGDGTTFAKQLPTQVLTGVQAVAAGYNHGLFLKTDGTLWITGLNSGGQLGDGTGISRQTPIQVASGVQDIAAGADSTFFLKTDGTLWASGLNTFGQLGDGTSNNTRVIFGAVLLPTDTPATLFVNVPATIASQSSSMTVPAGGSVVLSVTPAGTPPFSYQWFRDGVAVPNARSSSLVVSAASIANAGTYTVNVTNVVNTVTSAPILLDLSLPIVAGQAGVVGRDIGIQATTGGPGTISWQVSDNAGTSWTTLADGADYSGTTTTLLRIRNAPAQTTGRLYRYTVSDGTRSYTSAGTSVTMFTTPLAAPSGIVVDKSGNLIVTDAAANTVLKIAPNLKFTVVAGKTGAAGSTDGPGPDARFDEPTSFLLGDDGSITLTDAANSTIRVISPAGTVTTFAGRAGATGAADGDNAAASFNVPTAISADITGTLVIADQMNHTIRTSTGGRVRTLAGSGVPGFTDGTGTGASFFMPSGLAVRRDNFGSISWTGGTNGFGTIFVADQGNNTIRVISNNGQVGTYVGAAGQPGTANGSRTTARLYKPTGLTFDGDGNLYIADTGNHTIRKVNVLGTVTTFAGTPGVSGLMDGPAGQSLFNEPEGLAVDAEKNLYVTDTGNGVIRKITPSGVVSTLLVLGNVPVINSQPASQTVSAGGTVTFSVGASGDGPLTYQWRKDGQPIAGATGTSYSITSASSANAGSYTALVTNSWGSTESTAAVLTIGSAPTPGNGGGGGSSGGGGGGGGGAPSWVFLALLATLPLVRRHCRARHPAS